LLRFARNDNLTAAVRVFLHKEFTERCRANQRGSERRFAHHRGHDHPGHHGIRCAWRRKTSHAI